LVFLLADLSKGKEIMSKEKIWVDPPSGWTYGFPKLWDQEGCCTQWLVDNGYPQSEIDKLNDNFYCRMWVAVGTEELT
jgi:hypothetical protein